MVAISLAKQQAIAIAPKITSFVSVLSSTAIICMIARNTGATNTNGKEKRNTYHRLILGMSISDVLASLAFLCTTWPLPKGIAWGAVGNQQTCSAQGFFSQISITTVYYNAGLAVYYVLVIVKGMSDEVIAKKFEPLIHAQAIILGLGTALAGQFLGLYNPLAWDCWIAPSPLGCQESWNNNGETTCIRGDNASIYQWVFFYAPLWFAIGLVVALMLWIYFVVRANEKSTQRYRAAESQKHSKQVATKAIQYVVAFCATWLLPTSFFILNVTGSFNWWLLFFTAVSVPIQGFLNLLVYFKPTYKKYRKKNPDTLAPVLFVRALLLEMGIIKDTVKEQSATQGLTNTSPVEEQNATQSVIDPNITV